MTAKPLPGDRETIKRNRILAAGKNCFLNYGFKKTSMSDIAKQVNMSRPSLYLYFDNKETIFREIVRQLHQQTLAKAANIFKQEHHIIEAINLAFECRTIVLFAMVNHSTHGSELIDINNKLASKINRDSMNQFMQLISQALVRAESQGEIQLQEADMTPTEAAELLVNSAHGIKQAAISTQDYRDRLQKLLKMFARATAID